MADLSVYKPRNLLYTQEPIRRYRSDGYHPVCLGDTFNNGRYKIYHKLGWGGHATVWLANDTKDNKWVALKIMAAAVSKESTEVHNSQLLQRASETGPPTKHVVQVLDSFMHEGPNGDHRCIVLELLGPSVGKIMSLYTWAEDDMPKPDLVVRIAEQVLEGLQFMHHAGMAHGDISTGNIAFRSTNLSEATTEHILEVLGEPYFEELERRDGKPLDHGLPKYIVEAADWDKWLFEEKEDICILDLGEAFLEGSWPERLAQPAPLQAPETFFIGRFDHTVDLWAAGCVIDCLVFGAYPFGCPGDDAILVGEMIGFVDELPEKWQQKWDEMRQASQFRVGLNELEGVQKGELEKRFKEHVDDAKLAILLPVIQGLMRLDPSERLSASEALDLLRSKKAARCNMQA